MRTALALAALCAAGLLDEPVDRIAAAGRPVRLAGLSDTVPGLFLRLVNDAIKGDIQPRTIRYDAPSSVVLEDAVLVDPRGDPVARVTKASATLDLSSLLVGEIVISKIELIEPKLLLSLSSVGGERKLNLLEALTPTKPPDKDKPASGTFRVENVTARRGGFRFVDGENVTITADGISASAAIDVDLLRSSVLVDVKGVKIDAGSIKLPQLDIPVAGLLADSVRVLTDRLDVRGCSARVAGAHVEMWGSLGMKPPGDLGFSGKVRADKNAWPERLKRLPFDTPAITANVKVTGPYADPLVRIDGDLGRAELYGYALDSGHAVVEVKKDLVKILSGSVVRAGSGSARVEGTVALPGLLGDLDVRATDIPMAVALAPSKLDPAPKGAGSGKARVRGVFDGKEPITVDADVGVRRLEIAGVKAPGEVTASARVVVRGARTTIARADVRGPGVVGSVEGEVDSEAKRLSLQIGATAEAAADWVPAIPKELRVDRATFDGTVRGAFSSVRVGGSATAQGGVAWGVPFAGVSGDVDVNDGVVTIEKAQATAAQGALQLVGPLAIETKGQRRMTGRASVSGADLALVRRPTGEALPLKGVLDAEAVIGGTTQEPRVQLRAAAGGVFVNDEELGAVVARGVVGKEELVLDLVDVNGPLLVANTSLFRLRFDDYKTFSHVRVTRVDLARLRAAKSAQLSGTASGRLMIRGDIRAPVVRTRLTAVDVRSGTQRFGDGPVRLTLEPDGEGSQHHLVTASARLSSALGVVDATMAYAIQRKVLNGKLLLWDVDLAPFSARLSDAVAHFEGFTSGVVELRGPLDALSGRVTLRAPELAVPIASETKTEGELPPLRPLGEALIDLRLDAGALSGRVCAFPGAAPNPDAPCDRGERLWVNLGGEVDLAKMRFDLALDGEVAEEHLEDLLPSLSARGFKAGLRAHVAAQLIREPEKPVEISADATLLEASVVAPGAPRATLAQPAALTWIDQRLTLGSPARFVAPGGDADLTLTGSAGVEDIDMAVDGTAALATLKLFTKEIANAKSTTALSLRVSGKYADGVSLEGSVTPTPGAVITPRSLGEPVTFLGGSLGVRPLAGRLFRVEADNLRARVGDGNVQLRGEVDVRTAREADQSWVARFGLVAIGNGVLIRRGDVRAETSFDLSLEGDEAAPVLKGRVDLSEGSFKKSFELRNFVLAATPGKPTDPLWQTLTPYGLGNLGLDVGLSLSNFRVLAKITTFSADVSLRGNLKLRRTLRFPQLDGAVEVEEGTVDFPRARFEVNEMQLEFPASADGRLSPIVHLTARTEIPPGGAGSNDTEIPVDLALDGSLEEGLRLDLTAIDPGRQWSKSELLGLVLFGQTFESTLEAGDTNIAVRALLREATAPLTRELEEALADNLGVNLEIDAGGWRWQLGRRLVLEGAGLLVDSGSSQSGQTGQTGTSTGTSGTSGTGGTAAGTSSGANAGTDMWRVRFLVLDHLPVGSNLSFESRSGFTGSEVRLSLRIFEG